MAKRKFKGDTIPYARWYCLMYAEAHELPLSAADAGVEVIRQNCAGNELALAFWFRPMPMSKANNWLRACREDRATAREQIAKIEESFALIGSGVDVDDAFKE